MTVIWVGFVCFILAVLALDLGVFQKKDHMPSMREALAFTGGTAAMALVFALLIIPAYDNQWHGLGSAVDAIDGHVNDGHSAALKFLTGYVVELSLSMDNVFVIALIFDHLRVPQKYQHRVLFWGILGALAMRGAMISGGTALIGRYHWVMYVFGAFLVVTAVKMLVVKQDKAPPEERWVVRWLNRHFRVTREFHAQHFVIVRDGKRWLTPLAVALVLVETTDLLFAVDSIPAIFAITTDPFLVFTSNVFAIICLRSLYFGLAHLIDRFRYLSVSLAIILGAVGLKMIFADSINAWLGKAHSLIMLAFVIVTLFTGAILSVSADAKRRTDTSGR